MLHDDGAGCHLLSMADVSDFECDQVAATQLAVDAQIEEGKFSYPPLHLKSDTADPDVLGLKRGPSARRSCPCSIVRVERCFLLRP